MWALFHKAHGSEGTTRPCASAAFRPPLEIHRNLRLSIFRESMQRLFTKLFALADFSWCTFIRQMSFKQACLKLRVRHTTLFTPPLPCLCLCKISLHKTRNLSLVRMNTHACVRIEMAANTKMNFRMHSKWPICEFVFFKRIEPLVNMNWQLFKQFLVRQFVNPLLALFQTSCKYLG